MAPAYLLLLNERLKRHILTLKPAERGQLREKFDYLSHGLWDGGVRVKRLRGTGQGAAGKAVMEARLNRAERILFTLGRYDDKTAIYVWGIAAHDDVDRTARSIVPDNAPFLHFEAETVDELPELSVDEMKAEMFTQENVEEKAGEDYGPQKWLVLSDEEWRRLLAGGAKEEIELHLFLTHEQQQVLHAPLPLLLSGTAGSGKTTILVYNLLRRQPEGRRLFVTFTPLLRDFSERIYRGLARYTEWDSSDDRPVDFLVFRTLLEEIVKAHGARIEAAKEVRLEEFEGIFRNHRYAKRYDSELVWEEIRSIVKGAKPSLSTRELKSLATAYMDADSRSSDVDRLQELLLELKPFEWMVKVDRILERKTSFADYDAFVRSLRRPESPDETLFLLAELLALVEKRANSFGEPLLTEGEYVKLGRKRAPNFLYDRKEIYEIADYYQERLAASGLWDEIDLCRRVLLLLHSGTEADRARFQYDFVLCDEVQDFADVELSLLFRLVRDVRNLGLAGDVKQIINPSGFRWEEVKQRYFERGLGVPEVRSLSLNFRCVGGIVRVANALLGLKQRLVGLSAGELREDWKFQGRPPFVVEGLAEEEMLRRSRLTGAGRIILVREVEEQIRLKNLLETELVFTIREAKGLEFEGALLWKFAEQRRASEVWRRIRQEQYVPPEHIPLIRHEINLLYVAVTRARNTLIIYDGAQTADVWSIDNLSEQLERTSDGELLTNLWQTISTPEEWIEQAVYLYERDYFGAAAECFRNGGDLDRMELASAHDARKKGRHEEAATLFAKRGMHQEAAECWEECERFDEAATAWEGAGNEERALTCTIRAWEQEGSYERAADEWVRLGRLEEAARNWERSGNHLRLGEWLYGRKEYARAAASFERARDWSRAADSRKRNREYREAAELYLRAGRPADAAQLFRKTRDTKRLLFCYETMGDHYQAALLHEKLKDLERAIESLRLYAEQAPENRERLLAEAEGEEKKRRQAKAAVRFSALGLFDRAAPLYRHRRHFELAARDYRAAGMMVEVAECLSEAGRHKEAAEELERLDITQKSERVVAELLLHMRNGPWSYDRGRVNAVGREGEELLSSGEAERALYRFQAVNYEQGELSAWLALGRDEQAVEHLAAHENKDLLSQYLAKRSVSLVVTEKMCDLLVRELHERWFLYGGLEIGHAATLLPRLLIRDRPAALSLLRRYFDNLESVAAFEEDIPAVYLNLLIEARHVAAILKVANAYSEKHVKKEVSARIRPFFEQVKASGRSEGKPALLACAAYFLEPEGYEDILQRVPLSMETVELFSASERRWTEAVAFYVRESKTDPAYVAEAAQCCLQHGDQQRAAVIYEQAGMLGKASGAYRAGEMYDDAMRCATKAGDREEVARTHEARGDLEQALEIWTQLGKKREQNRVKKRLGKEGDGRQGELF